ncbi:hypothetical protein AAEO56_18315 [Flavobacterium sp. DGU11]|uniref:Uncharacterized protein n=1 Tax=Flavobacterium arundinis TaxID=3139143 RepID=A0ABU9I237_9FLAO
MQKTKKIRGHKRRLKQIEYWKQFHLSTNLNEILYKWQDHYAKIRIYPWNGFTTGNSHVPEPRGKTREAMLNGLFDIYENWKMQLDKMGEPYYLKIWLYEPNFSKSEVVCAIRDKLHKYDNTFLEAENNAVLKTEPYGSARFKIEAMEWEHNIEEEHHTNFVGEPGDYASLDDFNASRQFLKQMLKKPHRTTIYEEPIGDITEFYSFKRGNVWIGGD